jgi:hypothetical protein
MASGHPGRTIDKIAGAPAESSRSFGQKTGSIPSSTHDWWTTMMLCRGFEQYSPRSLGHVQLGYRSGFRHVDGPPL